MTEGPVKAPTNPNGRTTRHQVPVVKAVLCAGLYGNVAVMDPNTGGGAERGPPVWSDGHAEVVVHASSVNKQVPLPACRALLVCVCVRARVRAVDPPRCVGVPRTHGLQGAGSPAIGDAKVFRGAMPGRVVRVTPFSRVAAGAAGGAFQAPLPRVP